MTRREFDEELSDFGAGVFLKEVLAGDQVRPFGVGPDVTPFRAHNICGEHLIFPSPNDDRWNLKLADAGFKPLEPFSRDIGARIIGARINGNRAGPLPGQSPVVRVGQRRFVGRQRILPKALPVDDRELDAAPGKASLAGQDVRADDWRVHQPPRQDLAVKFRSGCSPCPGRHDGNRGCPVWSGEQCGQAGRAAPVVTDEANAVEVKW